MKRSKRNLLGVVLGTVVAAAAIGAVLAATLFQVSREIPSTQST